MRLDELYPYWEDTHQELLETVGSLTEAQLDARPYEDAHTIRQILLQFLYDERFWIANLVADYEYERPLSAQYPETKALVEALQTTRQITARVLEPFSREGLRAVRTVPADPAANRPETNMPVAWFFWHIMELEICAWGQVMLRLEESRPKRRGRYG